MESITLGTVVIWIDRLLTQRNGRVTVERLGDGTVAVKTERLGVIGTGDDLESAFVDAYSKHSTAKAVSTL
jgi:hypothetical protein